jgi:hypothetical protein
MLQMFTLKTFHPGGIRTDGLLFLKRMLNHCATPRKQGNFRPQNTQVKKVF